MVNKKFLHGKMTRKSTFKTDSDYPFEDGDDGKKSETTHHIEPISEEDESL